MATTQRIARRDTSVHIMQVEDPRSVWAVSNGRRTVSVFGTTAEDAKHTVVCHGYLPTNDEDEDWEVVPDFESNGYAEANRRLEALHGR